MSSTTELTKDAASGPAGNNLFKGILSACREGCAVFDRQDRLLFWNPAMEGLTGIKTEEALNGRAAPLLSRLFGKIIEPALVRAWNQDAVELPEACMPTSSTVSIWVRARLLPCPIHEGHAGICLLLEDVSEKHLHASAQKIADRNYRAIFENAVGGLFQSTLDGRFLSANSALAQMLAYDSVADLLSGITHIDTQLYESPARRAELVARLEAEGVVRNFEFKARRKDRQLIWISCSARLVRDARGEVLFIEGSSLDVTEKIEAEEEIRKLAAFPRFNPHPVLEFDHAGRMTYSNFAANKLARTFDTKDPRDILPQNVASIVRDCLYQDRPQLEHPVVRDHRTLSWSFIPIVANQVVHAYGVELTEKLNLEAQLRQSQKMESIGQLAAGVAHDFNNLLTVIQGNTGLLLVEDNIAPNIAEPLREIANASERAANLTRQLLTFSRRQRMHMRPLDLTDLLTNLARMLKRLLGEHIDLQFQYEPDLPQVFADPGMLEQVIVNLAVNARDAMPEGGRLLISTAARDIQADDLRFLSEQDPARHVLLQVQDTGTGMSEEVMEHLFEPFYTTKDVGKGTGLGLATVYGIIQQHHGHILVDSAPGAGSTFRIYLPPVADKQSVTEEPPVTMASTRGGSETILVVEDENSVRHLVGSVLHRFGYTVIEAATGNHALKKWETHGDKVDLLLTDMVMPDGLSGIQLAKKLRAAAPDLRICFTSGYSVDMSLEEFSNDPLVTFLPKPYHPAKLAGMVREILDRTVG